ncbi:lectin subunit alpha [Stomoxys calcitrans]|uniref:lectin subunit alpha n=1 Tax=Stomoxys calcitrans TaxID=35570 RepID=UPI0027E35A53|nr:lectin subunit alpha [Stomoxys calcitrans]
MAGSLFNFKWVVILLAIIKVTKGTPHDKWQKVDEAGKIFIEQEQKFTWFEANNECAIRNMTLIAVDTFEKNQVIDSLLRKKFPVSPNLWIGGSDLGQEGKFIWSSTGKSFEFTNWQHQQPDNSKNDEHCVHYRINSDFEWNDAQCWGKMGFICEENRFLMEARRDLEIKKNFIEQLFSL